MRRYLFAATGQHYSHLLVDIHQLASVTDAAGASVTYGYGNANSQMMGLPTSVTDSCGTTTTSTYDAIGRVTQTIVADSADLMYTYSSGNLSTVKRTDSGNSVNANI